MLREFIREAGSVQQLHLLIEACADTASRYQHRETGDVQLRPHYCQDRSHCPSCAVAYGAGRGDEVRSLIETLFSDGVLVGSVPAVKVFAQVYTLPDWLSGYLDGLVASRDRRGLRRALRDLTSALKAAVHWLFGAGAAAKVSWHWWHSSGPIEGPHWHAHVMIPNLDVRDGAGHGILRARGMLPEAALVALRRRWAASIADLAWVVQLGEVPAELSVHHRFLTTWAQVGHRARYDYRHPIQDFSKWARAEGLPDPADRRVAWFLDRCECLQGVKLVRAFGWLSNAKIKQLGVAREESTADDDWVKLAGWVEFERFDENGVHVGTWRDGQWFREYYPRHQVDLRIRPNPRGYRWRDPPGDRSAAA